VIRRLNYTGRVRIRREDVLIHVGSADEGFPVSANLALGEYDFPSDALVSLEAYRQTTWMRFPYGTVGDIQAPQPENRSLAEFDVPDGVLFRLKITQAGDKHILLGVADRIPAGSPSDDADREPLLPVVPAQLGDEIWQLDASDEPRLLVNKSVVSDWRQLAISPVFVALVYPAALRQILESILLWQQHRDVDDEYDWRSKWLRFAIFLPGVDRELPDKEDEDATKQWIADAVAAFSEKLTLGEKFAEAWQPIGGGK
jgi:hypothetical protein